MGSVKRKSVKELRAELEELKIKFDALMAASTELAERSAAMMDDYRRMERQCNEWKARAQRSFRVREAN